MTPLARAPGAREGAGPRRIPAACLLGLLATFLATTGYAEPPRVVLFGGGWGPEGTQASIEAHVQALRAQLPDHTIVHFAAGAAGRAVQIPAAERDETSELLGLIFDRRDNLGVDYRPTRLTGPARASKQAVLRSLRDARRQGPTLVFGAGHGAPATGEFPAALELWGPDDRLDVPELADILDASQGAHPTAFVLGQCHSGAFTDVMFVAADPDVGLADPTRCVFAAVPHDREAAGCTPDVDDPGARAYLAAVAAALGARDQSDVDKDGAVSLEEADAFARIEDGTVDVPVRTSELWLQRRLGDRAPDVLGWRLDDLMKAARPAQRAVLQRALQSRRDPKSPAAVAKAHERLDRAIRALDEHLQAVIDRREVLRRKIVDAVLFRWPELANPFHPRARVLLGAEVATVVAAIRAHPGLAGLLRLERSLLALDLRLLELQRRAARYERWLWTAQAVANEATLRARRDPAKTAALDALLACEAMAVP